MGTFTGFVVGAAVGAAAARTPETAEQRQARVAERIAAREARQAEARQASDEIIADGYALGLAIRRWWRARR